MKVKMLSRNPDNYVRETKLDIQRGERNWNRGRGLLPDSLGLASFRAVKGAGGQRSGLGFPLRLGGCVHTGLVRIRTADGTYLYVLCENFPLVGSSYVYTPLIPALGIKVSK